MNKIDIDICVDPKTESNCYILGCQGHAAVIDPNNAEIPLNRLKELELKPELILLSHEHCDHMIGMDPIRKVYPNVKAICSSACNEGLQSERLNMTAMMQIYLHFRGKSGTAYPRFKANPADITFTDETSFEWYGHTFRMKSAPGHTPGSSLIFLDDDILFSGDYLIQEEDVIVRMPGGSEEDYNKYTLPLLKSLPKGLKVYPGHKYSFYV